mgnify:CR=1 FL=1|tara:strand:- start:1161 stop:1502 length:342 start_codon:yes stop_codon:yes gene_type:complete
MGVGRKKGTPKTGGRQKGAKNKITKILKQSILEAAISVGDDYVDNAVDEDGIALDDDEKAKLEGGMVAYLKTQAVFQPVAFMSLLGKVMPLQLETDPDSAPIFTVNFVKADDK